MSRRAFSVSIYCRNADAVLLVWHRRLQVWVPVGGELEPGETPLEAAIRELREETGLVARRIHALGARAADSARQGKECTGLRLVSLLTRSTPRGRRGCT